LLHTHFHRLSRPASVPVPTCQRDISQTAALARAAERVPSFFSTTRFDSTPKNFKYAPPSLSLNFSFHGLTTGDTSGGPAPFLSALPERAGAARRRRSKGEVSAAVAIRCSPPPSVSLLTVFLALISNQLTSRRGRPARISSPRFGLSERPSSPGDLELRGAARCFHVLTRRYRRSKR
jgi:hypothetical protein